MNKSPTPRLVIGLVATLVTVLAFALYSLKQLDGLRQLQKNTIDRNRADSLHLLRVQNSLNDIGTALADMAGWHHHQGSWRADLERARKDSDDALRYASGSFRNQRENKELHAALQEFWKVVDEAVALETRGLDEKARALILHQLEARHHMLIAHVGGLLIELQREQQQAGEEVAAIYAGVERNLYVFTASMLILSTGIGFLMMHDIRKLFLSLSRLSEQRSTLAKKLITVQEDAFRFIARELHDDFGQILTAIGVMIQRVEKRHSPHCDTIRGDLFELKQTAQEALEKARDFSQALHPTLLDDYGLERAIDRYIPTFERQTGITVRIEKDGAVPVPEDKAIHVYRVLQEALTNVARHSRAKAATVRLRVQDGSVGLEVEDDGVGMGGSARSGLGLVAMRERADLVHGNFAVTDSPSGGTLVQLKIPLEEADE